MTSIASSSPDPFKIDTSIANFNLYSYPSFNDFSKNITEKDIFATLPRSACYFIGFGNCGPPPSFPKEFLNKTVTYYIFLFDPEFSKGIGRFSDFMRIGTNRIKIELYLIASKVPVSSNDHQIAKHTYALQQEASSYSYYSTANCTLETDDATNEWVSQFASLIAKINATRRHLYIVNDAWYNSNPAFANLTLAPLSVKKIDRHGKNFELICIIPKILLSIMNPTHLYVIKDGDRAVPFTHTDAVYKYLGTDGRSFTRESNLKFLSNLPNEHVELAAAPAEEAAAAPAPAADAAPAAAEDAAAHGGAGAASTRRRANSSVYSPRHGGSRQHKSFRSRRSKSRRNKSKTYRRNTAK